ncbi:MAG: hypothetical protein OES24_00310 [Acidimicrobiia bacterium]|nr:hypothetical protein [Acidimicrobiia bacterium]
MLLLPLAVVVVVSPSVVVVVLGAVVTEVVTVVVVLVVELLDPVVDDDVAVVAVLDEETVVVVDEDAGAEVGTAVVDRTVGRAVVMTRRADVVAVDDVVDSDDVVESAGCSPPDPAPVDEEVSASDVSVAPPTAGAAGTRSSATTSVRSVTSGFGTKSPTASKARTTKPRTLATEAQNHRRSVISISAVGTVPRRRCWPGTRTLRLGETGAGTAWGTNAAGYGRAGPLGDQPPTEDCPASVLNRRFPPTSKDRNGSASTSESRRTGAGPFGRR